MELSNETHGHDEPGTEGTATRTDGGKTLARGRDALAKIAGPRLSDFGVETGKALEPTRRGKKAMEPAAAPPQDESELPMFRPGFNWFVLRVASNKEDAVRSTLLRKVQIEGLEQAVGRIMVPTEKTKTLKAGKQKITETKLRFMPLQMMYERIAPEEPTRAPVMISARLPSVKPMPAAAQPE